MINPQEIIRIEAPCSNASWRKEPHANCWLLKKPYFKAGKRKVKDEYGHLIYGWVDEVLFGSYEEGKFKAEHPCESDSGKEIIELGYFDTIFEAMNAVLAANNPDNGVAL